MRRTRAMKLTRAAAVAAAALLAAGCYYMPGTQAGNTKVALGVKEIPPNLTSTALVVTAPGMATISTTAPTTSSNITLSVPAGPARTFTLLLNSPSATLQGVATVDLQPGENTTINMSPTVGATQLVIPDNLNSRLVQISDMNGTGWTAIVNSNFNNPLGTSISPYAVDFDSKGRIYIADSSGGLGGLLRIDDINHASTSVVVDSTTGITSVAVDRALKSVFYSNGSTIFVRDENTLVSGQTDTSISGIIQSMAADDQGMLYIVVQSTISSVVKYNPALAVGSRVIATSSYTFSSPWGIMVKEPYVYVSDPGAKKIIRFNKSLNFMDSFSGPSSDPLLGPRAFVAVLNRKITVTDEDTSTTDRLVSFDDMTGSGWMTFGSHGFAPAQNVFRFYTGC